MEYYSFKDILSGLRGEYLNIRKKIDDLKREIKILDSEISNIIITLENDNLTCYLVNKKHLIDSVIKIKKIIGLIDFELENIKVNPNLNNIYHFSNEVNHYHLIIENIKEFQNKVLNILSNSFTKSIAINLKSIDNNYNLSINHSILEQETFDTRKNLSKISFYPLHDFVKIDFLNTLTKDELNEVLNTKYDASLFNDYQRNKIELYKQNIILKEDNINYHEFNLEEENQLVLIKRWK